MIAKLAAERITDEQLGKLRNSSVNPFLRRRQEAMRRRAWMRNSISSCMKPRAMRSSPVSSTICFQTMMRLWYYLELWDKDFLSDADGAPNILKALEKRDPDLAQKAMRVITSIIPSRAVTGKFDLA